MSLTAGRGRRPAGLARRLAAILYDCLVLSALLMLATAVWVAFIQHAVAPRDPRFRAYLSVLAGLYFFGFWLGGQTLGMRAWRLRVERTDGARLRARDALLRVTVALLSWAALGIGFLTALIDREQRTWHDRLSSTRLVVLPRPRTLRRAVPEPRVSARD